MKQCLNCKAMIDDDALFCPECGTKAESVKYCVSCGKVIDPDSIFCPYCGSQQESINDLQEVETESLKIGTKKEIIDNISPLKPQNNPLPNSAKGSFLKKIAFAFVAIIIIGAAFWFMVPTSISEEEGKDFLEYFYNNGGLRGDEDFIRQHITKDAYNWLREAWDYDCPDDDCLGVYFFTRQPGADFGNWPPQILSINKTIKNDFVVSVQHEWGIYYVTLVLKKENGSIKIDELKDIHFQSNQE